MRSTTIACIGRLRPSTSVPCVRPPPLCRFHRDGPTAEKSNGERALNLLSFDDGEVTGLCSLLTFQEVINRLRAKGDTSKKPNPWEHFDLIAGTGTGALCAIMLGRLGMSVDDAIASYKHLMSNVFGDKKLIVRGKFEESKTMTLEKDLKSIVEKAAGDPEVRMLEEPGKAKCKVVVYAMSAHNMNAGVPCAFRTYSANINQTPDCSIWKALRASMAYPEHFKSIKIEDQKGIAQNYVGGGLGCSNPTAHLIREAATLYPGRLVASVVSIGAGHARTRRVPDPRRSFFEKLKTTDELKTTREIVTDNERVAEEMAARFSNLNGIYYRLNVDQGMQNIEWDEREMHGQIAAHTHAYTQKRETSRLLDDLVDAVHERRGVTQTNLIDGRAMPLSSVAIKTSSHTRPPTWMFTGRTNEIEIVKEYFKAKDQDQQLFVLHGLDGAGKTETALKSIQLMKSRFEGVVFINGSSRKSIEASLTGFAIDNRLGNAYTDALHWLDSRKTRWLMFFDNVDNPEVQVHEYFPRSGYSILITTKHNEIVRLAQGEGARCRVGELDPKQALTLLMKAAGNKDKLPESECVAAESLLQEFGYLPLAIVQCGAYICQTGCSISQYYQKYLAERREVLHGDGLPVLQSERYELSLHATWELSYKRLGDASKRLLGLVAFMYRDRVSEEIFRRAYTNVAIRQPEVPLTQAEADAQREVKDILELFVNKDGAWSSWRFQTTMGDLVCLSLITFDTSNNAYHLHPLVQQWARALSLDAGAAVERTSFLLALAINREKGSEDVAFRCAMAPHVNEVIQLNPTPSPNYAWQFIEVYAEVGKFDQVEKLEEQVLNARNAQLGPEDPKTLEIMAYVAETHALKGRLKKAEALKSHILDCQKHLGDDHDDTLKSLASLATTYHMQGRLAEAEELKGKVLAARIRVLGRKHPDTLWSLASLAVTYHDQGRLKEAKSLYLRVIAREKRLFGVNHPATLSSMADLAAIYHTQGLLEKAQVLKEQVRNARERLLGEDHPDTWQSMADLAATYHAQGRLKDAESLNEQVLAAHARTLGDDHLRTLQTMAELAATYHAQGRLPEAETLKVKVLAARKRLLGEDHPETLWSQASLAVTQHRSEEAESLYSKALEVQKRVPDKLQVTPNLDSRGLLSQASEIMQGEQQ